MGVALSQEVYNTTVMQQAMGKKRECGSETGKKRESSRFLPGYDVTD